MSGALAGLGGVSSSSMFAGQLPEGPDGGRGFIGLAAHDLRQLAARRAGARRRAVRVRRRAAAARSTRRTPCSCSWRDPARRARACLALLRRRWSVAAIVAAVAVGFVVLVPHQRRHPDRVHPVPPHLDHAASCWRSPPSGCGRRPPTGGPGAGAGRVTRLPTSTGTRCGGRRARSAAGLRAVLRAPRSGPPALVDDGRDRRRLQRRERVVRPDAVRRVRPGVRACTPPAAGGWWRCRCVGARRRRLAAVRAVPAAAVRGRRPGAARRRPGGRPLAELLPDAFGPDDLPDARRPGA